MVRHPDQPFPSAHAVITDAKGVKWVLHESGNYWEDVKQKNIPRSWDLLLAHRGPLTWTERAESPSTS